MRRNKENPLVFLGAVFLVFFIIGSILYMFYNITCFFYKGEYETITECADGRLDSTFSKIFSSKEKTPQ